MSNPARNSPFIVTIKDNDMPVNTAPVFTDGASAARGGEHGAGQPVPVGAVVAATDTDTLTYTLEGTDSINVTSESDRSGRR